MFLYFIYFLILILFLFSVKKNENNSFLESSTTKNINGLFVCLVFLAHFTQYIEVPKIITIFKGAMGQLIVVPFLFFSGYGVTLSFLKKENYRKKFLINRILYVYLQFICAVILFCLLDFFFIKKFTLKQYLLSLTGLVSVGNSNWYIVAVLVCYFSSYIGFFKNNCFSIWISFFIILIYSFVFHYFGFEFYWYNKVFAYFAGEVLAYYNKNVTLLINIMMKSLWRRVGSLVITFLFLCFFYLLHSLVININVSVILYNIVSIFFCIFIMFFTSNFRIDCKVFNFFGNHVFSIYILQRIPMILLKNYEKNPLIYFLSCISITLILSISFDFIVGKIKRK